jgi:GTP-binding protein EngB required for normal cell division
MNNLDIAHSVSENLGHLRGKSKFKKIIDNLPRLCVMGAQSSGKSSVIKRLTGICLPTSTGTCSRIVTHIISRKGSTENVKIYLKSSGSSDINHLLHETSNISDPEIEEVLRSAQSTAIRASRSKSFVSDFVIVIYVVGKNIVNSNMADFPGYTTNNIADRKMVEDITMKYLNLDGTIVLHVCRSDVDVDSQPGNDIISSYTNLKKILVLTYCDNVLDTRTQEILDKTIQTNMRYKKFAILGNFSSGDEIQMLSRTLSGTYGVQLGSSALSIEIESMMNYHMATQFPILRASLSEELVSTKLALSELTTESPFDILLKIVRQVEQNLLANRGNVEKEIRCLLEEMRCDIMNIHITIKSGQKIYDPIVDGDLKVGMKIDLREVVGVKPPKENGFMSVDDSVVYAEWTGFSTIESIRDKKITLKGGLKEYKITDCQIAMKENDQKTLINVIKDIINTNRGIINTNHIDIQPAIEYFSEDFAIKYKNVLKAYYEKISNVIENLIIGVFSQNLQTEPFMLPAIRKKQGDFIGILNANKEKFLVRINELAECNMKPLVFSSNDDGLNLAYLEITKGRDFTHGNGIYDQIYYKAKAYLKEQKIYVIEDATKKGILILYHYNYKEFLASIYNNLNEHSQLVILPPDRQEKIKDLTQTVEILNNCISLL